ncbi:MAG: hypothetical protein M1834_005535 [Cirrosporium novae-zelandiae]|nr:MAG: hypothetical protein M1834_005535 [Cirrosporium novae-zelandiae]
MVAPAIPEIIEEDDLFASIDARTEALQTLRELGPPDLVHLVKQSPKAGSKQIGVYHHVTGNDASSSASLAAYVNTLIYMPNDKTHKVVSGLYCCYNAFSHLDMRVEVKIPGGVECYCIDERGDKRVASEGLWLETFLCGILRAYSYADDGSGDSIKKIVGVRRFNPITSTEAEHKFLEAAEKLFWNGRQLGSDSETQIPNTVSNHLTAGLLKYIHTTGRYASGINLFEKLRTKDIEVSSLLARVYISADEEVQAVGLLHEAVKELPMDYSLLDCQAEFCKNKGEGEIALECAKRSVTAAPSEFCTWARLADIYISLEQWDLALLTLNSCPMFTYQDKDAPRLPEPTRVVLPIMPETVLDELDDGQPKSIFEEVHSSLRKLHAANYQGTFLRAYSLLTKIAASIGWDQLLKIRSHVFVMEEEYRSEKQTAVSSRNTSTTALRVPSPGIDGNTESAPSENGHDEGKENGEPKEPETPQTNGHAVKASTDDGNSVEKPGMTVASETVKAGGEDVLYLSLLSLAYNPPPPALIKLYRNEATISLTSYSLQQHDPSHTSYTQFQNKRLCERWLDNLFMVLYEDLRIYTIWRTEQAQFRSQKREYKKSAAEWEILGELAERLHHEEEATEAYQMCLSERFSPKSMRGLLRMWERDGDARGMLGSLIRLIAWQYRWYSEFSPELLYSIRKLIEHEGAVKVRSIVQATNLPQPVLDLTHHYCQICATFRSSGSDG